MADLKAFEDFLGNKKYLMGERICNEDASMFGGLAQVINHDRGPFNNFVMSLFNLFYELFILCFFYVYLFLDECPNIMRYYNTMKNEFWPGIDFKFIYFLFFKLIIFFVDVFRLG